jgi:hypothetical protein
MPLQTLCKPRPSAFAADRRTTVLYLDKFLKAQVYGPVLFDENYFTNGILALMDKRAVSFSSRTSKTFQPSSALPPSRSIPKRWISCSARIWNPTFPPRPAITIRLSKYFHRPMRFRSSRRRPLVILRPDGQSNQLLIRRLAGVVGPAAIAHQNESGLLLNWEPPNSKSNH